MRSKWLLEPIEQTCSHSQITVTSKITESYSSPHRIRNTSEKILFSQISKSDINHFIAFVWHKLHFPNLGLVWSKFHFVLSTSSLWPKPSNWLFVLTYTSDLIWYSWYTEVAPFRKIITDFHDLMRNALNAWLQRLNRPYVES